MDYTYAQAPGQHSGQKKCAAMVIGGLASGQGKTTLTAALARYYTQRGRKVRVFKCGPDFLDPMILEQASGAPVYQLDLWMSDEAHCRDLLHQAAAQADVILIEGAMGVFDGDNSSADLAQRFNLPLLLLIDAAAMAQTFGAIAYGLANYRDDINIAGVFANRVASDNHYALLAESLPPGVSLRGWMRKDASVELPRRHLGLVPAHEQADLMHRIDAACQALQGVDDFLPQMCDFPASTHIENTRSDLQGKRIAIARDRAFAFIYPANLDFLRQHGAQLSFFSPLKDRELPECDAIYIPGGYPELCAQELSANQEMAQAIREKVEQATPLYAECGGLLYLLSRLYDSDGNASDMLGIIDGEARMQTRLVHLGLHQIELYGGQLRGHSFHYSSAEINAPISAHSEPSRKGRKSEAFYQHGSVSASYLHIYFPSCPTSALQLFLRQSNGDEKMNQAKHSISLK